MRLQVVASLASMLIAAVILAILAFSMPPDGFFSGDPGVKLIAALNAAEHPSRPFNVDLPTIAGAPTRYVERFFWLHGDHSHVLQSPLFPVVTAPFVAAFGVRGAYLLPAVAFVLLIALLAPVFRKIAPAAPFWLFLFIVIAANPVFFYALEFWEHLPAVALLAAATALMLRNPVSPWRAVTAGVITSIAILFRPEAAWYALGLAFVAAWRGTVRFAIGLAAVLLAAAALNYAAFGTPLGPHTAANLAPLSDRWLEMRLHRIDLWLVPSASIAVAGLALIALAHLAGLLPVKMEQRQTVALVGAAFIGVAAASGQIGRDSLWQAWPAGALVLAYLPGHRSREPFSRTPQIENGSRPLFLLTTITSALILLTSTHDGGAQWGPRFLLIATPAMVVLSAWAAAVFWSCSGGWATVQRALVLVVLAAALVVSRDAFRELRGSKRYYARLIAATERLVPERGYVVTNVWWFDQITAPLYGRHTVLNVVSSAEAQSALADLEAHAVTDAVVVTSPEESADVVIGAIGRDNCFAATGAERIPERSLTFTKVRCR